MDLSDLESVVVKGANKRAVRRWLSKALEGWKSDWVRGPGGELLDNEPPAWACLLHRLGLWRVMSCKQVRRVHFDPGVQDALLAAHRLGGDEAVFHTLREHVDFSGLASTGKPVRRR